MAVKRDAQGFANVSERVWYPQLSATAAGHATRILERYVMDHRCC